MQKEKTFGLNIHVAMISRVLIRYWRRLSQNSLIDFARPITGRTDLENGVLGNERNCLPGLVFPHTRFFSMEMSLPMESTPQIWDGMENLIPNH